MNDLVIRIVDAFPEPAFSTLAREAFADYEPSAVLTEVLDAEAAAKPASSRVAEQGVLRIAAFRGESLVGWTCARREGTQLHVMNSGVDGAQRRRGIYSMLVQQVIDHATAHGDTAITSRHAANNNAVIIAKLKLGFFMSGFEYSEIYGPLVRLTFLPGDARRALHRARSSPIRRADS